VIGTACFVPFSPWYRCIPLIKRCTLSLLIFSQSRPRSTCQDLSPETFAFSCFPSMVCLLPKPAIHDSTTDVGAGSTAAGCPCVRQKTAYEVCAPS